MRSLALTAGLWNDAPVGLLVLTMDGTALTANPAFLELCHQQAPLPSGWSLKSILSAAGVLFFETHIIPVLLLRGALNELALDLLLPGGDRVPVLVNARLRRNADGTPSSLVLALMKMSERRQFERELLHAQKSAERIADIVRRSSDAILTLSPEGTIQSWNTGAEQMFAYTHDEAIGRSFVDLLFATKERSGIQRAITSLAEGKQVARDVPGLSKTGNEINLSITFTPHMEAPGTLVAFSAIIRDVTSSKRTEKALIQSEKIASVGRLASSIAHEINNPLESVTNLLYILRGQMTTPETALLVASAEEELARVSHIVTHTLRFHRQSSSRSDVDIRSLLDSILALYRPRLHSSDISVDLSRSDTCHLYCYEGELRQVIANLIGNAFDAMRTRGGRLILRSRCAAAWPADGKDVRITIADTGGGMDRDTLRQAFEPFFTTKGIGGTGLGLWIAEELISKNGGRIRVRSSSRPGRSGSVFVLSFPHAGTHAL